MFVCFTALRTVCGKSLIHSRVKIGDTHNTKNLFKGFVLMVAIIDVFQTLLGFQFFLAEIWSLHSNVYGTHCFIFISSPIVLVLVLVLFLINFVFQL